MRSKSLLLLGTVLLCLTSCSKKDKPAEAGRPATPPVQAQETPVPSDAPANDIADLEASLQRAVQTRPTPATLHKAAIAGDLAALQTFLGRDGDVNVRDAAGRTALHYAAMLDHGPCVTALLQAGARVQVDAQDTSGRTALHYAAALAGEEVVTALLRAGASQDLAGPEGTAVNVALARGNIEAHGTLEQFPPK
jgi:ankyrin repeat protein